MSSKDGTPPVWAHPFAPVVCVLSQQEDMKRVFFGTVVIYFVHKCQLPVAIPAVVFLPTTCSPSVCGPPGLWGCGSPYFAGAVDSNGIADDVLANRGGQGASFD